MRGSGLLAMLGAVRACAGLGTTSTPVPRPIIRPASGAPELWTAASLLKRSFADESGAVRDSLGGTRGVPSLFGSLCTPDFDANVYFNPSTHAVAVVREADGDEMVGVAQIIRCQLRYAAGADANGSDASGRDVAFLQNVAVDARARRRGLAAALVAWCELEAARGIDGGGGVDEVWLAVSPSNAAAIALYEALGYKTLGERMGQRIMSKAVIPDDGADLGDLGAEFAEATLSLGDLGKEIAVQTMYVGIGCLGISALLAPFAGPSVPALVGVSGPWLPIAPGGASALRLLAECAAGVGVATAELGRLGALSPSADERSSRRGSGAEYYSGAQADQMAPLFRIVRGDRSALKVGAAVATWQLAVALAEELYYRGLLQSGVTRAALAAAAPGAVEVWQASGAPPGIGPLLCEVPALLIASAVFGLVHIDFVLRNKDTSGGDDGAGAAGAAGDDAWTWFIATARYGALYGALFTLSGHRVIAPACAHAALNTGITLRDWRAMRGP